MTLQYTNTQGRRLHISDVRRSSLPGFVEGTCDETGERMLVCTTGAHNLKSEHEPSPAAASADNPS